jgi:hypothetical protein
MHKEPNIPNIEYVIDVLEEEDFTLKEEEK